MSKTYDIYLISLSIAVLKKKKSLRAKTGTVSERAMKQWRNSGKWAKEGDLILDKAAREAEARTLTKTVNCFMKCLWRLLSEELNAERCHFNRSPGRPKAKRGMLYLSPLEAPKRPPGRPIGEPFTPSAKFVWGVKFKLFAKKHKFHDYLEVEEHLRKYPNDLDLEISDKAAVENAERIYCAKRGEIFDPCRMPALKTRYSRAKKDFSILNHLQISGGNNDKIM